MPLTAGACTATNSGRSSPPRHGRTIVLIDRDRARAKAVATDMHYGVAVSPLVSIRDGDYADLADAG